ncbi:MAG: hypothetical protein ABFS56_18200 [Pseudomonadota bacterium]
MDIEMVGTIAAALISISLALSIFALIRYQREKKRKQQSSPESLDVQISVKGRNIVVKRENKESQIDFGSARSEDLERFLKKVQ